MSNKKITELTEVNDFSSDNDLIPIVINTDTTPSNASISKANLEASIGGGGTPFYTKKKVEEVSLNRLNTLTDVNKIGVRTDGIRPIEITVGNGLGEPYDFFVGQDVLLVIVYNNTTYSIQARLLSIDDSGLFYVYKVKENNNGISDSQLPTTLAAGDVLDISILQSQPKGNRYKSVLKAVDWSLEDPPVDNGDRVLVLPNSGTARPSWEWVTGGYLDNNIYEAIEGFGETYYQRTDIPNEVGAKVYCVEDDADYILKDTGWEIVVDDNFLALDNVTPYTPNADYEPATKKYVDDNAGGGGSYVDLTTAQSIGGIKTFTDEIRFDDINTVGGDIIIENNGARVMRALTTGAFSPSTSTAFFQLGNGSQSGMFTGKNGGALNNFGISTTNGLTVSSSSFLSVPQPREMLDVGGNVIANGYKIPNGLSTDVLLADGTTTTLPSGGQLLSRQFGTNITFYSGNEWTRPAPGSDFQTINERSFSTGATATVRTTGIDLLNIPANAQLKNMHFTFRKNFLAPNCTQIQIQILARNYDVNGEYGITSPVVLQTETLTPNNGGTYFSDCNFFDIDLSGIASTTVARNITVCFRQTDDDDTSYTARTNCLLTYEV